MKSTMTSRILTTLLAVALLPVLSQFCRADDIADAKTQFDNFVQYSKTDDPKMLDLFTKDCVIKMTMSDGTHEQSQVVPTANFLQMISDSEAKKQGDKSTYDNITAKQDGALVRVSCMVTFTEMGGGKGPLMLAFIRDTNGKLRIKEFSATLPAPPPSSTDVPPPAVTTPAPAAPADGMK